MTRATRLPGGESLTSQTALLRAMVGVGPSDAMGVALSFLLHCSQQHPDMLRRVLNEPVIRHGFRGESMAQVLSRIARS